MIRLFVSDIDGCLSEPYRAFDRERHDAIARLAATGDMHGVPETPPAFSICTGRPYAYAEAVTQALGVACPVLFEAGAGLFDPSTARTKWHPDLDPSIDGQLDDLRTWLTERVRGTSLSLDMGKRAQAGVIGPRTDDVLNLLPDVRYWVSEHFPDFVVASTPISIDVMSRRLTKAAGMRWLARELGITLEEMAFIGDTNGDMAALELVGRSFAPANAAPEVRAAVQAVTAGRVAAGVQEAYLSCIRMNSSP